MNICFFYFPNQLPIFALGILFYHIVKEEYSIEFSPVVLLLSSFLLLLHLVGFSLLPSHILFGIAFILLGIAISKSNYKILKNPILLYIGKISYSMYLVHFGVLYWLTKLNMADFIVVNNPLSAVVNYCLRFVVLIFLSVLISSVSYKLIELPGQKLGRKIVQKLNKNSSFVQ